VNGCRVPTGRQYFSRSADYLALADGTIIYFMLIMYGNYVLLAGGTSRVQLETCHVTFEGLSCQRKYVLGRL
jgi:hypothetical protein